MDTEKHQQNLEVWMAALVVVIAVFLGLHFKGVSGETVTEAITDIFGALIPILSAFVAARLVVRQMDPAERFQRAGEDALAKLAVKHPSLLSGPKASRENYDPENPGKAGRYLFYQKPRQKQKAQFIPVFPLRSGIVEIRISRTALLLLGVGREMLERVQQDALARVEKSVETMMQQSWPEAYEILEHKHPDISIVVDFDEASLGVRKFRKAVYQVADTAIGALAEAI